MSLTARFVESITPNPTVRLDVNDGTTWRLLATSRLDPPPAKRARISTLLANGAIYPASAYEDRVLELHWLLRAASADAIAAQIQLLARELDRADGNFLEYQVPGMTHPVFFRTQRLGLEGVEMPTDGTEFNLVVSVPAEPFAYGLPEYLRPARNSNPLFESTSSPWTASGGSVARSTAQAYEGAASLLLTPNGSATAAAISEAVSAAAGDEVIGAAWVYSGTGWDTVRVAVEWYNSTPTLISTSNGPTFDVPAGEWTRIHDQFTAPANTATMKLRVEQTGTPAAGNTLHIDDAQLRSALVFQVNPASDGNLVDITGVKGDVSAPLLLQEYGLAYFGISALFAVRSRGDVTKVPYLLQAEAMTQGTDTTTQANDANYSGSGNNFSRCTFTTATMQTRLSTGSGFWPATPSVDARGTYRVFARVKRSSATGTINLRLRAGPSGSTVPIISTVATPLSTQHRMVDFGLVQIPSGSDPVTYGPSGRVLAAKGVYVELQAERTSGTSTIDFDYLLFVPADEQLVIVDAGNDAAGDGYALVSSTEKDVFYAWVVSGGVEGIESSNDLVALGSLPRLAPDTTNRIFHVFAPLSGHQAVMSGNDATYDATYWPQYLNVRPAST